MDWKHRVIISKLGEGCTVTEAAAAAGITRQAVLKRMHASPEFAAEVAAARETSRAEREYRLWLRHPCRGKRPPTGKGHGGRPRFAYGRR